MASKIFNFLLVILLFKSAYSANFNYLFENISNCEKNSKGNKESINQFVEEYKKFKEGNHSQITNQDFFYRNDKDESIDVHWYYLYTRDYHNGKNPEILYPFNMSSLDNSHLKQKPIYVLVHGFEGNGSLEWIVNLKDALLKKEDCNVLSFDWPAGNMTGTDDDIIDTYILTTHKVPHVGRDAAIFIKSLVKHVKLRLESVHFIGHSLGAHVCGFTGKHLKGIGRITGLDPAGPLYEHRHAYERLDKSDAVYVDVIHTDACDCSDYCYGLNENIGHSNFFPNNGFDQPGCPVAKKDINGCSHFMSYKYFIASLDFNTSSTYFLARPCDSWYDYLVGKCPCVEEFQYMGFYARPELQGSFYLQTSATPPYAMQDEDCLFNKFSDFFVTNYTIIQTVGMIIIAALIIIMWRCFSCSLKRNDEEPLLDNKKAFGRTDVV